MGARFRLSRSSSFAVGSFPLLFFLEGRFLGGWDEQRPKSSTVPTMKTVSRLYPAHFRPLSTHFLQEGRWLSHYCRMSTSSGQTRCHLLAGSPPLTFTLRDLHVSHPLYLPGTPTMIGSKHKHYAIKSEVTSNG